MKQMASVGSDSLYYEYSINCIFSAEVKSIHILHDHIFFPSMPCFFILTCCTSSCSITEHHGFAEDLFSAVKFVEVGQQIWKLLENGQNMHRVLCAKAGTQHLNLLFVKSFSLKLAITYHWISNPI